MRKTIMKCIIRTGLIACWLASHLAAYDLRMRSINPYALVNTSRITGSRF